MNTLFRLTALGTSALIAVAPLAAKDKDKKRDRPQQIAAGRTPMPQPAEEPAPAPQPVAAPAPTASIAEAIPATGTNATLAALITQAQFAGTLGQPGPYTVFAPSDEAFTNFGAANLDQLKKPENAPFLQKILQYQVVPGEITAEKLKAQIAAGGGSATLTTLEGTPLTAKEVNGVIELTGAGGNKAYVSKPDVKESNGVIHVVNGVILPKLG